MLFTFFYRLNILNPSWLSPFSATNVELAKSCPVICVFIGDVILSVYDCFILTYKLIIIK